MMESHSFLTRERMGMALDTDLIGTRIMDLLPVDNFLVELYDDTCEALSFPYVADEQARGAIPEPMDTATPITTVIREGRAVLHRYDDAP